MKQSLCDGPASIARLLLAQLPSCYLFQILICGAVDISRWRGLTNSVGQQGTVFHRDHVPQRQSYLLLAMFSRDFRKAEDIHSKWTLQFLSGKTQLL